MIHVREHVQNCFSMQKMLQSNHADFYVRIFYSPFLDFHYFLTGKGKLDSDRDLVAISNELVQRLALRV